MTNNLEIWQVLRECCEACLKGRVIILISTVLLTLDDYELANKLFTSAHLKTVNGDLSEVRDAEDQLYAIEKYCFSTPSNLLVGYVEDDHSIISCDTTYQFRVQSVGSIECTSWIGSVGGSEGVFINVKCKYTDYKHYHIYQGDVEGKV